MAKEIKDTLKGHYKHKERLSILEKHLGKKFYDTGEFHIAISDAMEEYSSQSQGEPTGVNLKKLESNLDEALERDFPEQSQPVEQAEQRKEYTFKDWWIGFVRQYIPAGDTREDMIYVWAESAWKAARLTTSTEQADKRDAKIKKITSDSILNNLDKISTNIAKQLIFLKNMDKYLELIEAQKELIEFYGERLGASAIYLHINHMDESKENIEKGARLRLKIEELNKEK